MTTPTREEMQTASNRLVRLHHVPTDALINLDADHIIVTLARVEDYDRLRVELRLHPLATYKDRETGWFSEGQITLILAIPYGVIPAQGKAVA